MLAFIASRTIQVKVSGTLFSITETQNGVPQAAVLNVTVFLIGINNITENLKPPIKSHLFADDITLTCNGKDLNSIVQHLETATNHLYN